MEAVEEIESFYAGLEDLNKALTIGNELSKLKKLACLKLRCVRIETCGHDKDRSQSCMSCLEIKH